MIHSLVMFSLSLAVYQKEQYRKSPSNAPVVGHEET